MNIIIKKYGSNKIYFRPDSSLCREGDLYLPDRLGDQFVATPSLVIKSIKSAKCVKNKFARRYYEYFSFGVTLYSNKYLTTSKIDPFNLYLATSFDNSIYLNPNFTEISQISLAEVELSISDNKSENSSSLYKNQDSETILDSCDTFLSEATELLSLKSGDLLFLELNNGNTASRGDNITLTTKFHKTEFSIK